MSRVYRVSVSGAIERVEHLEDRVCGSLDLLPILPKERMQNLLAKELSRRGFEVEGNLARKEHKPGISIEVDLDASTVSVKAEGDLALSLRKDGQAIQSDGNSDAERVRQRLVSELESEAAARVAAGQRQVTESLEGELRDLKGEIDSAINRVTAEALKEKARTMGEIEEMTEDQETGSLTIKVRL